MDTQENAPLTPKGREAMVRSVIEGGPPFAVTQGAVLVLFILAIVAAVRRFRPA